MALQPAETDRVTASHNEVMHAGRADRESADWLRRLAEDLRATRGAQAVVVGATELSLALPAQAAPVPVVDCIALHLDEIVRRATG